MKFRPALTRLLSAGNSEVIFPYSLPASARTNRGLSGAFKNRYCLRHSLFYMSADKSTDIYFFLLLYGCKSRFVNKIKGKVTSFCLSFYLIYVASRNWNLIRGWRKKFSPHLHKQIEIGHIELFLSPIPWFLRYVNLFLLSQLHFKSLCDVM